MAGEEGFGEVNLALNLSDESQNDQNALELEERSQETKEQPERDNSSASDVAKESEPANDGTAGCEEVAENEDDKGGVAVAVETKVGDNGSEGGENFEGRIVEQQQGSAENEGDRQDQVENEGEQHNTTENKDTREGEISGGRDNETFEDSEKKVENDSVDSRDANKDENQNQQIEQSDGSYLDADANSNYNTSDLEESGDHLKRWETTNLEIHETPKRERKEKNGKVIDSEKKDDKSKASPFKKAFFLSKYLTFWWMQSLFSTGYKKVLDQNDLYDVAPTDSTNELCSKLEREWHKEAYDENGKLKEEASLTKVIIRVFGFKYMLLAIPAVLAEGFRLAQPVFLGFVTRYFSPLSHDITTSNAYLYGLGLALSALFTSLNIIPLNFVRQRLGMRARIAASALVYRKVLRLSNKALSSTTTGHIVNLVSVDAQKLDFAALFLHYLWISPIIIIVTAYLLWREIGPSSLAGVGLLLLMAPLQMAMGRLLMKFRRLIVKNTDQRVKVMNEVITGMRVIKLYTWEDSFTKLVDQLRKQEIHEIRKLSFLRAGFMSFFFSSASLVSFITMMTYVLAGNKLTAQKVFTCVSLFNGSRLVMTLFFPIAVTLLNEARVSLERMQKLLLMDELRAPGLEKSNLRPKSFNCQVAVDHIHASWTKETKTLDDINMIVGQGELAAIVGPVGSGKSSLLMAILGELPAENGTVNTVGRVAYVSQEAWIFNGSLKNNITFGQEFDEKKYKRVIEICALERDIKMLPNGDLTLVGERGVSLSGGQKARVNLARAVYFDADIYILDDPLSAVDAHVGRHLFDQCINGYLSSKVRILVTHQLQYLSDADQILVLSEGKCIGKGTYDGLVAQGVNFMNLLRSNEDPDSALDTDYDDDGRNRSFSRQESAVDERRSPSMQRRSPLCERKLTNVLRERTGSDVSIKRSMSMLSHRNPDAVGSDLSIASKAAEVDVYVEKVIPKEKKYEGSVTYRSYLKFFQAGYGLVVWTFVFLMFMLCQGIYILADWWLARWTNQEEKTAAGTYQYRDRDLGIYAALVISLVALGLSRAFVFFFVILRSSRALHGRMFRATLRAPLRFFDTNSVGRILNRFSKDIGLVDDMFSFVFFDFTQTSLVVIGIILLVCASNPIVFAWAAPIVILFFILRWYYIKTAREVKRIEGLNRSPLFGHFSTTLLGLPTIRAFGVQENFTDFYNNHQDEHTKAWFAYIGSASWLSFRLEILSLLFISFVVFISIAIKDKLSLTAGQVGLMLAYTINITGVFQQCVRQSTEVENHMTSVERVLEYCELESEPPAETDVQPPDEWPKRGSIRFKDMSFSYAKGLPNVLNGINCHIKSNEKIGVCGRTGAGKSSLLTTLFRLSEPTGSILIDDIDILKLGLKDLRRKISIIPQDPVLFSGSMRKNLDPFSEHSDVEVWGALEEVQLKEAVEALPGMLESEMAESGNNLSVGQRQLVCLARAILRRNKILVIDEATANVDPITDSLIQTKIREKFKDCTVLTIAHRLNTIMDSDRIMVLDGGKVREFDEPYNLLRSKNNLLYKLVAQTGGAEAQKLYEIARKSHFSKSKKGKKKKEKNGNGNTDGDDDDDNGAEHVEVNLSLQIGNSSGGATDGDGDGWNVKIVPDINVEDTENTSL